MRMANKHIRMISEGLRNTEDWGNDAANWALITRINYIYFTIFEYIFTIYSNRKQLF